MNFKYLSKALAENQMELWQSKNGVIVDTILSPEYENLKEKLNKVHNEIFVPNPGIKYDLSMAFALYEILNDIPNFTLREASKDDFWTYMSIQVVPTIVGARWGSDNRVRFYLQPNRTYLKSLYWYIHLSWQGDRESTDEILSKSTTDTLVQLVERPAKGFDTALTREIMKQHYIRFATFSNSGNTFRKLMKLNTAYLKTIEPHFFEGGVIGYVNWLYSEVSEGGSQV